MKRTLLFLVSLCSAMYIAQTIQFTDPNFKTKLLSITVTDGYAEDLNGNWTAVDTNGNGEIEVSEAQNLSLLELGTYETDPILISDLTEISYFSNLNSLYCENHLLTTLDVSDLTNLNELSCSNNQLTSLNISGLTNISYLACGDNQLTSLDVSQLTNLQSLGFPNNNISSIDLSASTNLETLYCPGNQLTSLDVSGFTNLEYVFCSDNQLTSLEASGLTNIIEIDCSVNQLTTLDLSNSGGVILNCEDNDLVYLNLIGSYIINQSGLTSLEGNNFQEVCCDSSYFQSLHSYLQSQGYENCIVNVGADCSPVNQSVIALTMDADNNGCTSDDEPITNYNVQLDSSVQNTLFQFSDNSAFIVYSVEDIANITPNLGSNYYTITPAFYQVDYAQSNVDTLAFCVTANGVYNDLEISILPIDAARPGFEANYKLKYRNVGTTTLSGEVSLAFEDDYLDLISATPTADSQNTNLLSWNYSNLQPFEEREFLFTMELNTPTDANFPLNSGDILEFATTINPIAGDETPANNVALLNQDVVNSFDPNDKILLEGETITPEMVGEYVHYRIRFENTGTANAINIFVEDDIDANSFDINTLQVVDASHAVKTVIEDDLVKFQFYNINLPFDDANNDGYVVFKIKTLATLALDDTFSNQASIFFDYNAPIVTNDFVTTVSETLGVEDVESVNNYITLSPNPVKTHFTLDTKEQVKQLEIYDSEGRLLQVLAGQEDSLYDVSSLKQGVYLLNILLDNHEKVSTKFIKE